VVDEVGEGVTGTAVGDRVFGLSDTGTTAEYAVLTAWAPVPQGWTPQQAAAAGAVAETSSLPTGDARDRPPTGRPATAADAGTAGHRATHGQWDRCWCRRRMGARLTGVALARTKPCSAPTLGSHATTSLAWAVPEVGPRRSSRPGRPTAAARRVRMPSSQHPLADCPCERPQAESARQPPTVDLLAGTDDLSAPAVLVKAVGSCNALGWSGCWYRSRLRQVPVGAKLRTTLYLPKVPSGQVRRHARTRGGCRRGGHVGGCSGGRAGVGR
jgi:hypothetical protein